MPIPLVERSEREIARRIRRRVRSLDEVSDCDEVAMGFTRKKPNIHFRVLLRGNPTFEEAHKICFGIDGEVRNLVPNARVVIHSEPSEADGGNGIWNTVKRTAEGEPGSRGVQNIHLRKINGTLGVDFHLQVSTPLVGSKAAELEARVAQKLKAVDPRLSEVVIHQESVSYLVSSEQWGHGTELRSYVEHVSKRFPELVWLGRPTIWRMSDGLHLVDRVAFMPGTSDPRVALIKSEFGDAIKKGYPAITKADIVEEPRDSW